MFRSTERQGLCATLPVQVLKCKALHMLINSADWSDLETRRRTSISTVVINVGKLKGTVPLPETRVASSHGWVALLVTGHWGLGSTNSERILLPSWCIQMELFGFNNGGVLVRRASFCGHSPPVPVFAPPSPNNLEYFLAVSKNLAHPLHPVYDDGKGGGWKWGSDILCC